MQGRLLATLRMLVDANVEFVLVGGLAAVLQGAPIHTYDVDIVFSQQVANVAKLLAVLESLDAVFRIQPWRRIRPNETHLMSSGHLNLLTKYGHLDLLTHVGDNLRYTDLLGSSTPLFVDETSRVNVLSLRSIIKLKEQLGGEKDLAMLPLLRRTLSESEK